MHPHPLQHPINIQILHSYTNHLPAFQHHRLIPCLHPEITRTLKDAALKTKYILDILPTPTTPKHSNHVVPVLKKALFRGIETVSL
mmetsp:Transcript_11454/g.18101  ORF Transcript_11454/g.18101 Transcript_11454/m.18101 type:complete len:86 (-) Transcript_11454:454-711(-)